MKLIVRNYFLFVVFLLIGCSQKKNQLFFVDSYSKEMLLEDSYEEDYIDTLLMKSLLIEEWEYKGSKVRIKDFDESYFADKSISNQLHNCYILELDNGIEHFYYVYNFTLHKLSSRLLSTDTIPDMRKNNTKIKSFYHMSNGIEEFLNKNVEDSDKSTFLKGTVERIAGNNYRNIKLNSATSENWIEIDKDTLLVNNPDQLIGVNLNFYKLEYNLYYLFYWNHESNSLENYLIFPENREYPIRRM